MRETIKKHGTPKRGLICIVFFSLISLSSVVAQSNATILPGLDANNIRVGYDFGQMASFAQMAEYGLKIIYLIMWPMITVAAAALDNSLVYGDAFKLTPALFKFWQIIRTFTNFTLGFYFVRSILTAWFNNKLEINFKGLIRKTAIAGLTINLSRWMIAALIDISTILTVSLGGLPLFALGNDISFKENIYYLKSHSNLNVNASTNKKADVMEFSSLYSCTPGDQGKESTKYYLPCAVNNGKLLPKIDPKESLDRDNYKETFKKAWQSENNEKIDTEKIEDKFCVYNGLIIENDHGRQILGKGAGCNLDTLVIAGKVEGVKECAKVDELISKSQSTTGPLFALYSSILRVADLGITTSVGSTKEISLLLIIKFVTALGLIIPLVAFAVVMVVRIVYLWMIIIFSPMIALIVSLEWKEAGSKVGETLQNIFNPGEVVKLIILPAVATFGLSISIVFLSLLHYLPLLNNAFDANKKANDGCLNDIVTAMGVERNAQNSYDMGITEVTFEESLRNIGTDIVNIMAWLFMNFFGIALMRMIVFATLKISKFTDAIATKIQETAQEIGKTLPIIPIAGGIGINAAKDAKNTLVDKLTAGSMQEQNDAVKDMFANISPEKGKLNNAFAQASSNEKGIDDQGIVNKSGINEVTPTAGTDYKDYSAAPQAFAKQAAEHINNNQTISQIQKTNMINSVKTVNNWEDAMKNKEFVDWMHETKSYDKFAENRDQKNNKNGAASDLLENGLKEIAISKNEDAHWYLYNTDTNNYSKFTVFNPVSNGRGGHYLMPKTQIINTDKKTPDQITEDEVTAFNTMKALNMNPNRELFKTLNNSLSSGSIINIKGRKIKANGNRFDFVGQSTNN